LIRRAKYHVGIARAFQTQTRKRPGLLTCRTNGAMKCPMGDTLPTHTLSGFPKLTGDAVAGSGRTLGKGTVSGGR